MTEKRPGKVQDLKRPRSGYNESNNDRVLKVYDFIKNLHFSVPLYRLREQHERNECPKCHRRRLFYCYDCLTVVHPDSHPPPLSLPINVHVILHPNEIRGKSTSLAASTISPDLHILEYPAVPEHLDPATTLVLYPSAQSVELKDVDHLETYKDVVFVDSTWQQSKAIARDERVTKYKHVKIKSRTSLFWRFQNNDPTYLATVEAIYYFLREYITQVNKRKEGTLAKKESDHSEDGCAAENEAYHGEVDDLLFYYINQYVGVQQRYSGMDEKGQEKHYTTRHFDGYILKGVNWDDLVAPPSDSDVEKDSRVKSKCEVKPG